MVQSQSGGSIVSGLSLICNQRENHGIGFTNNRIVVYLKCENEFHTAGQEGRNRLWTMESKPFAP